MLILIIPCVDYTLEVNGWNKLLNTFQVLWMPLAIMLMKNCKRKKNKIKCQYRINLDPRDFGLYLGYTSISFSAILWSSGYCSILYFSNWSTTKVSSGKLLLSIFLLLHTLKSFVLVICSFWIFCRFNYGNFLCGIRSGICTVCPWCCQ